MTTGSDEFVLGRDLAKTPFAHVLSVALKQKLTGELIIRHPQGENRVYFRGGFPAGAKVMYPFTPLGRMLVDLGWITQAQLSAAVEAMEKGKRQGEALVDTGALTAPKLDEALKLHQIKNLTAIARLKTGELRFNALSTPPEWASDVTPNALRVLRAALAVPESDPVCQSLFDRAGVGALLVIPPHLVGSSSHFEFDTEESAALHLLQSPMTLGQFFARSRLPLEKARSLAAVLLLTNLLVPPERAVPTGAEPLLPKVDDKDRDRRRRMLERAMTSLGSPFGRRTTSGNVPVTAAPPSIDLPELADYGTPNAPGPRSPPTARSPLSPDEQKLKRLIEDKAKLLPTQDSHRKLGLSPNATKDQIKTAFVEAAKIFHPDHLPPSLADLAGLQRDLFGAIKEAYDALMQGKPLPASAPKPSTPTQPNDQRKQTSTSFVGRAREEEARTLAKQGDTALKARDYAAAVESFHQAHELAPRGDYVASEAWALFSDPARKGSQKDAREMLERAASTFPDSERVAQYLGTIARIDGKLEDAYRWLKKATVINPKNGDAASELHLVELKRRQK